MAFVSFKDAASVTNAMAALSGADRMRCLTRAEGSGFVVEAPDDLVTALSADHPQAPLPVPDVSSAQAKIQLSRAKFLPAVKETVAALGGEVEIWFTDARAWQRNNPHVNEIGAGLNLTPSEIDDLFREAAKIDA